MSILRIIQPLRNDRPDAISVESSIKHWRILCFKSSQRGTMSRLSFAEKFFTQKNNTQAALGRIVDVDVAAESTRLARNNVLVQASAAMLAQANTNPDIALMLIR